MVIYNFVMSLNRDSMGGFDEGFTYCVCKIFLGLLIGEWSEILEVVT